MTEDAKPKADPSENAAGGQAANGPRTPGAAAKPNAKRGPGGPGKPAVVQIRPLAEPATMKRRHWGLVFSFGLFVLLPLVAAAFYLFAVAEDQYGSTVGFTVRKEEGASASDLIGGLAQFAGTAGTGTDADVLFEFIQSQEIVERIQGRLDLVGHYAAHWGSDPVFSIWPDARIEDLLWFWKRVVRVAYDRSSGLTELQVVAFDPEMAQRIAQEILNESQTMINALNETAREDAMRYALQDQKIALDRLKAAREAMTRFRSRTQIVDPSADIQGRMGVLNNLQQQLAEALIELDLLTENATATDPRVSQAQTRIEVIRQRIRKERDSFASAQPEPGTDDEDYPALLAEYESLSVDQEFAEQRYVAAMAALEAAEAMATRQTRYLATYIQPTRAQQSEYPQRFTIVGLMALLLLLSWSIVVLIYYSIRDRR